MISSEERIRQIDNNIYNMKRIIMALKAEKDSLLKNTGYHMMQKEG